MQLEETNAGKIKTFGIFGQEGITTITGLHNTQHRLSSVTDS